MSIKTFYGTRLQTLWWPGSQATHGKISVSDILNCLNYCVIFIVCTWFTNMATGYIIKISRLNAARMLQTHALNSITGRIISKLPLVECRWDAGDVVCFAVWLKTRAFERPSLSVPSYGYDKELFLLPFLLSSTLRA